MPLIDRAPDLPPAIPIDAGGAASGPSGTLLQPGGPGALPLADPILELDARRLLRLLAAARGRPPRWDAPAFGREVDLVRAHLQPIGSRALLLASFGREAFHGQAAPGSDAALGGSAVRVAYALRWLELRDGARRASWRSLLEK